MKPTQFLLALAFALASTASRADCFDAAGAYQHVSPLLLRAIAWQESHNHPEATHKNENGSTDYGLMQINSIHLPALSHYGVSSRTLMKPCESVYVAAWHLKQKFRKYGNSWDAVGAYHSETPALRDKYARQIMAILAQWHYIRLPHHPARSEASAHAHNHDEG